MIAPLLLALLPAAAQEPPFPDRGLEVASPYDYETNSTWSQGPVEGLRELYTDPQAFVRALIPAAPLGPHGELPPLITYPTPVQPPPDNLPAPAESQAQPGPPPVVTTRPIPGPGPMVPAHANLVLVNRASGWAEIAINGQRLGVLGPLARATLLGVRTGQYDVSYTLSTGYSWTERVSSCPVCTARD